MAQPVPRVTVVSIAGVVWAILRLARPLLRRDNRARAIPDATRLEQRPRSNRLSLKGIKDSPQQVKRSCEKLAGIYAKMAQAFREQGLNTKSVEETSCLFSGLNENSGAVAAPMLYTELPLPLPSAAVRILVVPLEASEQLASAACSVGLELQKLLPSDTKVFHNLKENLHITIFHTSQPTDPRPDPAVLEGGTDLSLPPHERPGPSPATLERETAMLRSMAASTPAPTLQFERVVLAESGTLLFTWVDPSGIMERMRSRIRHLFPGAATKQASILHTSVCRLLTARQLPEATRADIDAMLTRWSQQLRGSCFSPSRLWWVHEVEFSTIKGPRALLPLRHPEPVDPVPIQPIGAQHKLQ